MAEKLKTTLIDTASRVENSFKQVPVELLQLQQDLSCCEGSLKLVREDVYALCTRLSRLARLPLDDRRRPLARLHRVFGVEVSKIANALDLAQQRCLHFRSLMQATVCAAAEVVSGEQDMIGDLDEALKTVGKVRSLMLRDQNKAAKSSRLSLDKFVEDLQLFSLAFRHAFNLLTDATKAMTLSHIKIVAELDADQRAVPAQVRGG